MRFPDRIWRIAGSWRGDVLVTVCLVAVLLVSLAAEGQLHGGATLLGAGCVTVACGCIPVRRSHPQLAAVVAAVSLAVAGLAGSASTAGTSSALPGSVLLVPVLMLAYSLGASAGPARSAPALLLLGAGAQLLMVREVNPFALSVTIGPWAAGLVARSRRQQTEQLALRGRELAAERELFAAEAVRYQRAAIARELHDIVAHCVSVMVIQAAAGQRLAVADPALAAGAFDSISETARQAETEIGRLAGLLGDDPQSPGGDGIQRIGELITRAGAAGLAVSCRLSGSTEGLPDQAGDAAYRVVQESLTNAFRHAPGAAVQVTITGGAGQLEIGVANEPPAGPPSGLERAGTGRGLAGMRERVTACGGELSAGPVPGGGWQVLARLPGQPGQDRQPGTGPSGSLR